MDTLPENPLLKFLPNTLKDVRKNNNFDKSADMERAIDILELWIKKQDHFLKKNFNRSYLERFIIRSKGSVEKTKSRLDKMCAGRSLVPDFFGSFDAKDLVIKAVEDAILPKLTKDNHRLYILNVNPEKFDQEMFIKYYRRTIYMMEYCARYDYHEGVIIIVDYRKVNIMDLVKAVDVSLLAKAFNLGLNAYGLRIKSAHLLASSKLISLLVSLFKQLLSEKLAARLHVHENIEALYDWVDKDLLTSDLGGKEKTLSEFHQDWLNHFSTKDFKDYIQEINEFKTNENLRVSNKNSEDLLSMSGTFRNLAVD